MKRRVFLRSTLGALGAVGAANWLAGGAEAAAPASRDAAGQQWRERAVLGFGTLLSLRVAHSDARLAEQALDAAVGTIRHVEAQMSLFDANSALSRLNRDGVLRDPHPDLVKVFHLARSVSARSGGASC